MPTTRDRILRAPTGRTEPKVFVNPELADPGALGRVVHDLRSLLRDARKATDSLAQENTRGQRLAHSLAPFLRQHSQLVEQHAKVLKLIDERAGEATAIYKLLADRAEKIDLFDSSYNERMNDMRKLLATIDSRMTSTHRDVGRIEEQSLQAITRLRREFDAHMIQIADEANSRIESSGDRLESLERSARLTASTLYDSLDAAIDGARSSIAGFSGDLDTEIIGARVCLREAIAETHDATDKLYADLERQKIDATKAAIEVEDALESSQEAAHELLGETQSRIDNTLRLGRLKLDELCNAFTTWIEAGQSSIDQAMSESAVQMNEMCNTIAMETTQSVARLGVARNTSIKQIESTSAGATSKVKDAERAIGGVVSSVRTELAAFDTAMLTRIDETEQRLVGIVDREADRAESLRAEIGKDLDDRLADLTGQCDRAQAILLGENGPDTTGLLVMLEKAESLEKAVETADERAAFATKQLEVIREQANEVRKTLGRAVLLAADATDQADTKAALLNTALEQARNATDRISGTGRRDSEGAD